MNERGRNESGNHQHVCRSRHQLRHAHHQAAGREGHGVPAGRPHSGRDGRGRAAVCHGAHDAHEQRHARRKPVRRAGRAAARAACLVLRP